MPSFSCLEAKGWLDLELDSLILSVGSRWRSDGCSGQAQLATGLRCMLRLLEDTVLGAEDLPGSTTAGSKCRYLSGAAPVPEIGQEPGVPIGEAKAPLRSIFKKQ